MPVVHTSSRLKAAVPAKYFGGSMKFKIGDTVCTEDGLVGTIYATFKSNVCNKYNVKFISGDRQTLTEDKLKTI